MSVSATRLLDRFRQPEYTGSNRCIPCTIVNVVLAVAFAAAVGVAVWSVASPGAGTLAVATVLVVSLLAIYVRGYLVPGTPTLTKRYLPDRVLALFDKEPAPGVTDGAAANGDDRRDPKSTPEQVLVDGGVTVPCENEEDLCLADGLRERWREHVVAVREGDRVEQVADFVERDPAAIELDDPETEDRIVVTADGEAVATWESDAALIADLAGARLLADELEGWTDRHLSERGQIVGGLRAFLETCPACDGRISIDEETVESCCRSYEVYAVTCNDCETRLLEVSA